MLPGVCHLLNDMHQPWVPAACPILKDACPPDCGPAGLIMLALQPTASSLRPAVGVFTDRRPQHFALPPALACSLASLPATRRPNIEGRR
jgi:FSR family fosmidomycin resistance protein-like MFS transporter